MRKSVQCLEKLPHVPPLFEVVERAEKAKKRTPGSVYANVRLVVFALAAKCIRLRSKRGTPLR